MERENHSKRLLPQAGHFVIHAVIKVLTVLVLVTLPFLLAALLFNNDPDGYRVRTWLSESRYWLFAWRLIIYTVLSWLWIVAVRPRVQQTSPTELWPLRRLEWVACTFIIVSECAIWRSVLA